MTYRLFRSDQDRFASAPDKSQPDRPLAERIPMRISTLIASIVAGGTILGIGVAAAADLPPAAYTKAPPIVAPVYNWTGFYVGANMGYGAASDPVNMSFSRATDGGEHPMLAPSGWLGGAQLGYNFQAGRWVLGVEGDIQASALSQSPTCFDFCAPGFTFKATQELSWFATARGRVGYTMGPALIYATGGAAFTNVKTSLSQASFFQPDVVSTFNDARTGWALGGGIEAALGGHWTAKVEYLYMDFGRINHTLVDPFRFQSSQIYAIDIHEHVFRVGVNYLFNDPSRGAGAGSFAGAYAMMPPPAYNWTGFYVGGNLGAGVANGPGALGFDNAVFNQTSFAARSLNGGLQAGANWQTQNLVLGVEGDIQLNDQRQKDCFDFCLPAQSIDLTTRLPWFATLRGRIGYGSGPLLVYGTAGAALGRVETSYVDRDNNFVFASGNFGEVKSGWTAGGGIEAALSERWTAKAEYLYLDLGGVARSMPNPFGGNDQFSTTVHDHVIRVGLNYKVGP
ncbi:outer membrane protein [Afipia sp. GAS231]|uniref:outer membrane protein n=1 Tax=Afipia sp. GAS231 TaxID=1882747 RepID=UPI001560FA86|nr:outer membrane protein [Afipia sp. GAS231]